MTLPASTKTVMGKKLPSQGIGGVSPEFVSDFSIGDYRVGGKVSSFDNALNFSRTGPATYVDATGTLQTVADGVPREDHHIWDGSAWVNQGLLKENAATNLLHTTDALVTQSTTVTAVSHTLHFTGTGTVTLSGASTAGPLVGTGTGENNRVSLVFTPTAGSLTLTVSGTVSDAQLETGVQSSYIPNLAGSGTATRNAETLTASAGDLPYNLTAVSIQMEGTMSYADEDNFGTLRFYRWILNGNNDIRSEIDTNGANTGLFRTYQVADGVIDTVASSGTVYTPGINVPFNIASRHGSTFINGAVDGTALTANTTPTALPDLTTTDLEIAPNFNGTIKLLRIWGSDIGDTGIAQASA